ncbi:MAG: septal ring lytic transglycosylase RlpA family protein [Cyclobacteriaceae bacterium]|nr:septal ring lytic transglycosylase RlpA family protein [Cyclobacteriaceae bacterium]MCH8516979.1 septal ring lytic transglycosylase RlpA family protein [Cyclobacteriaceae bacterium]
MNKAIARLSTSLLFISIFFLSNELEAQTYRGEASFYANKFHGRTTASGEKYDKNKLTAAHRKLPFGTKVKVTNDFNGKSVIVIINDRGPFVRGRIIDLSLRAAKEIDMVDAGIVKVTVEILEENANESHQANQPADNNPPPPVKLPENNTRSYPSNTFKAGKIYSRWGTERQIDAFSIQVASFETQKFAIDYAFKLAEDGFEKNFIHCTNDSGTKLYRISVGSFHHQEDAEKTLRKLKRNGYDGFVKSF